MAETKREAIDSLLDMEKELTCSPLTLLDCLHTFCGHCLKEWFAWQAASTANSSRRNPHPYTCPSCRESVRSTKADWRLTALLEGFLKAHPDRRKSDEEKEASSEAYKPGENVIPKVEVRREDTDSEDERLMAEVRDMSMANVDPETARRRTERAAAAQRERRRQNGARRHQPEEHDRSQQPTQRTSQQVQLSEERLRQHNANELHVEHQPSLRSLLSASPIESQDVQQEILQSIYAEGLLEGIDIDNLTPEQEDQLTERIAAAYRRTQRRRDRSGNRERGQPTSRSPQPPVAGAEDRTRHHARTSSASMQQPRTRPPVSRPHLFEQQIQPTPAPRHQRTVSGTSQRSNRSANRVDPPAPATTAARSATDLTVPVNAENTQRERHRRASSNVRSTTDPEGQRAQVRHMRTSSNTARDTQSVVIPVSHPLEAIRRQAGPTNNSSPSLATSAFDAARERSHAVRPAASNAAFAPEAVTRASSSDASHTVRQATSMAAFAPETVTHAQAAQPAPTVNCSRCGTAKIQHDLHYHCSRCRNGSFNMCQACYREGQGCDHWYGFGFKADERYDAHAPQGGWPATYERPHVLAARRYPAREASGAASTDSSLQEGAFCESCSTFANECYWYCLDCLEGAWGYCDRCVQQGRHCSHPILPVAHLATLQTQLTDPSWATFVPMPHLTPGSYVLWPVTTDCDVCHRGISPNSTRFHCYECSEGDYDVCRDCYYSLLSTGKISQLDGPSGWRRCLQGHRMALVGFENVQHGGQQRIVDQERLGGWRHKNDAPFNAPPSLKDRTFGPRCLALYSYCPRNPGDDDLTFPKNAEISEVREETAEWFSGVYCGKLGLFPSSHVRKLVEGYHAHV
ncbi:hypothetical protein LTR53_009561 [Teratosphaeriaceae sp. CCFEE 6253]|nr:hypothetical protein LTR53_009561 [Teratosphaeriaceae sp. CCFEE 6253]